MGERERLHERLAREGWEYRFTASEPGLSEHVQQYFRLGFEVHLEPITTAQAPSRHCGPCVEQSSSFAVFVRRAKTDHSP